MNNQEVKEILDISLHRNTICSGDSRAGSGVNGKWSFKDPAGDVDPELLKV
jgi:hypothetical protein